MSTAEDWQHGDACGACHGSGTMHDGSHGPMACDRCNGSGSERIAMAHDVDLVPVDIRVKPVADELAEVRARMAADKARADELTAQVREMTHGVGGIYGPVQVTVPRELDKDALAAAYPVAEHPYLYSLAIDPAKAKAHLSEDVLDRYKVDGTPRVGLVK